MYNKLFTKILDSSIWLESVTTRIVWVTFIACMDMDGFVALSSVGNVANRARVSLEEAEEAIRCLENPDVHNPDQDHEGRRIERIPGLGWYVLNAKKYRDIVKAETIRAQTRERTERWRERTRDATVTVSDENVTPSETETNTEYINIAKPSSRKKKELTPIPDDFTLTDDMRTWFAENCQGLNVEQETKSFIERCKSKGTEYKDWKAGWRTQMLNAVKWSKNTPAPATSMNIQHIEYFELPEMRRASEN